LKGARFYLMRIGVPPFGIVGSGQIVSEHFPAGHWGKVSQEANYAIVEFDSLSEESAQEAMDVSDIMGFNWHPRAGGITIPPQVVELLQRRWDKFAATRGEYSSQSPDEVAGGVQYPEGATRRVPVNVYERNRSAREECIRHYGPICRICDLDFSKVYGMELGAGFIHVHHLVELSEIGESYKVDPHRDLIPVCANCHAMLHRQSPAMMPEVLRSIVQRYRGH
jgi:5-methylcytosine-specific restriction enzyme A